MSVGPAFNSLGQILAMGGEIAVARAILRGESADSLSATFGQRFAPIRGEDLESVFSLANLAITAGDEWLALPKDTTPDISLLPINPFLFGDDWFGKRVRVVGHGINQESGGEFDIWLDLPDIVSLEEFNLAVDNFIELFAASDPTRALQLGLERLEQVVVEWLIAERRY